MIIEPDLSSFNSAQFKNVEELILAGYRATKEKIPDIKEKIAAFGKPRKKWWQRIVGK